MRYLVIVLVFCSGLMPYGSLASAAALDAEKTVLITGSNRGIGFGFVEHYVNQGWNVIATARKPALAKALQDIAEDYENLAIEQLDVTDHERIEALAKKYHDQPIDVLINNAGMKPNSMSAEIDYERARRMFEVNVFGPVKIVEAFMPQLKASSEKKVVNISSMVGSIGGGVKVPMMHNYRASKTALNSYMAGLSYGSLQHGVIITLFHPGRVDVKPTAKCAEPGALDERGMPASICVRDSVAGMTATIEALTEADNGKFFNYVPGQELPW